MPAAIVNLQTGAVASAGPNTSEYDVYKNILLELRVISTILLAEVQGQPVAESVEQLRQDVVNAIPNPLI